MPSSPNSLMEQGSTVPRVPSASEELSRLRRPSRPGASNRPTTAPPAALRALGQHQPQTRSFACCRGTCRTTGGTPVTRRTKCANIPESRSTCLFIVNLPPGCTPAQLLGAVPRGVGQTHVPGPHGDGPHPGDIVAEGRFVVPEGYRLRVMMNRYCAPSQPASGVSRARTPSPTERYPAAFFGRVFRYDLDGVAVLYAPAVPLRVVPPPVSVRAQGHRAGAARRAHRRCMVD
ncbi:hypothetical protein DL763_005302 [Monosporascus cannonballus]|nr:hypothetical protein DL763_005302 [Monosporascus cannonballus]